MSVKAIRELKALGMSDIPPDYYPEGWLQEASKPPDERVNLNKARVVVEHSGGIFGGLSDTLYQGKDFDPDECHRWTEGKHRYKRADGSNRAAFIRVAV